MSSLKLVNFKDYEWVNPGNNRKRTTGLFKELRQEDNDYEAPFSLEEWHSIYLQVEDPTEYETHKYLTGNWEHWQFLRNHPFLKNIFDSWKNEVEVKIKSRAVMELIRHAQNVGGTQAAKWLAEGQFNKLDGSKRVTKRAKQEIEEDVDKQIQEDMQRILGDKYGTK